MSDSNKIEISLWRLLYFQLQTSYCQAGTNPLPSIVTVNDALKNAATDAIPISILLGQYAKIKDNAYTGNLLTFNSSNKRVYDVAGRTQSPYTTNNLFAASPLQANNFTNTASFVYNPSLVWANTGLSISQLQVNFDDGQGFLTLAPNTPVNISYADTGYHTLTIKATLSNNAVLQCYSTYYVLTVSNTQARYTPLDIVNPPWGSIAPVAGVHGGGTISYILSNTNTTGQLKKPLIVAENMDVFSIAPKLQEIPYRMEELLTSIQNTVQEGYDFNEALDVAQYDLVFVNFTKGEDGVINNAKVFKEAITKINENKGGDLLQNVVLGIGTGGIIARYALADVTKQLGGNPTQTRLLITHDAPHRGANIALGIQMMTRMLGSYNYLGITARQIFPEYEETMKYYDAPINQDILLYRSTSDQDFSTNTFINAVYQPMVNYISPYKFVATSLGNECANQLMPAGSKFIDMGMEVYAKLKGKVFWGLVSITLVKVNYETLIYARAVPTATDGNRKIASVKCVFALKLFGAITLTKTGYDKTVSASTSVIPYDGVPGSNQQTLGFNSLREYYNALEFLSRQSSVLNTTNSVYEYINAIKKAIEAIKKAKAFLDVMQGPAFFGLSLKTGFTAETQSFYTEYTYLPVGSALDVDPFNTNTFTQKYVNGVNLLYPSKGNNFIAQETVQSQSLFNNAGMRFTARNARFMFKEMEQLPNTENCSAECSSTFILSGSDQICTTAETFNLLGLPAGVSIVWEVTPAGKVTLNPIGNSVTLTRNPNANGLITLSAKFSICGINKTYTKDIHVGLPDLSQLSIGGVTDNQFVCPDVPIPMGVFYINSLYSCGLVGGGITNAQWMVETPSSSAIINYNTGMAACEATNNNAGVTITFPNLGYPYTANVSVRASNSCGWTSWFPAPMLRLQVNPYYTNCGGGGFENRMVVSPNPSTGTVTIQASQDFSFTQIRVFDKFGVVRKQFNFPKGSKKVTINIGDLPTDMYEIQAFDGKNWSIKPLIKQ